VLRTRPPLVPRRTPVRLACVKRAASVRPEPGSNSPIMNRSNSSSRNETTAFVQNIHFEFPRTVWGKCCPRASGYSRSINAHPQPILSILPVRARRLAVSCQGNPPVSPGGPRRFPCSFQPYNLTFPRPAVKRNSNIPRPCPASFSPCRGAVKYISLQPPGQGLLGPD
jgi:hypothetical protein